MLHMFCTIKYMPELATHKTACKSEDFSSIQNVFQLHSNDIPVWVRRWAWRDFSLGNTLLQKRHLIALGDVEPSTIKLVIASALGLPLLLSWRVANSGELQPLAGLCSIFWDSPIYFQEDNIVSFVVGVLCNSDTISSLDLNRFGVFTSIFHLLFQTYPTLIYGTVPTT
jgi:hypothetical protein